MAKVRSIREKESSRMSPGRSSRRRDIHGIGKLAHERVFFYLNDVFLSFVILNRLQYIWLPMRLQIYASSRD